MRKSSAVVALAVGAGLVVTGGTAIPAAAVVPGGEPVHIVAHTVFGAEGTFEANLDGCSTGTVADERPMPVFTPWGGAFFGDKVFSCAGGESGFTLRLKARFGPDGSTGTWVLVDGWGDYAGVKGSGSLVGVPVSETQIDDVYTGSFR